MNGWRTPPKARRRSCGLSVLRLPAHPTDGEFHLALGEIKKFLGHHEFRAQARVTRVEFVEQPRFHQAMGGCGRTRHADGPNEIWIAGREVSLETGHRYLDLLGVRPHLRADFRKLVTRWTPAEEATAEVILQRRQRRVHGGVARPNGPPPPARARAAISGENGVVPVEHRSYGALGCRRGQVAGRPAAACSLRRPQRLRSDHRERPHAFLSCAHGDHCCPGGGLDRERCGRNIPVAPDYHDRAVCCRGADQHARANCLRAPANIARPTHHY